jgi:hypothetical protein
MSTNAYIGVQCEDGIRAVYLHWDGYPKHAGEILNSYYTDFMKVCELINMGDISSLGNSIGEKHSFQWFVDEREKYEKYRYEWCTFYKRDRDEEQCDYDLLHSETEFLNKAGNAGEYAYLFINGAWITYKLH